MLMFLGALILICMIMSTKADRTAARERMRPIGRIVAPFAIAIWAWIIWTVARGPPP
jgi:hypothetical protein